MIIFKKVGKLICFWSSVSEKSEKAFTSEQKSPDICRCQKKQRPAKTYERRSFIQSTTEETKSSDNETDPDVSYHRIT